MLYICIICYTPEALSFLIDFLTNLQFNEILLTDDFNTDWKFQSQLCEKFKECCLSLNFTQNIDTPTRPNKRCPDRSSILDLFLTNMPHIFHGLGVFAEDMRDHCIIGVIRYTKLPRSKPRLIKKKRDMKCFNEQAFLWGLSHCNWQRILLTDKVNTAWNYFQNSLI